DAGSGRGGELETECGAGERSIVGEPVAAAVETGAGDDQDGAVIVDGGDANEAGRRDLHGRAEGEGESAAGVRAASEQVDGRPVDVDAGAAAFSVEADGADGIGEEIVRRHGFRRLTVTAALDGVDEVDELSSCDADPAKRVGRCGRQRSQGA